MDSIPTPEQLAMGRRIAANCPGPVLSPRCHSAMLRGECDDWHGVQSALAAIIETSEATAAWLEQYPSPMDDLSFALRIREICGAIRSGNHLKAPQS